MLQESLHQQERILGRGYEEVLASLRHCAAVHPVPTAGADAFADVVAVWGTPEILGRLEAMCMLLMQADRCAPPFPALSTLLQCSRSAV